MKTKILVVLAAIALVFALVFTACGDGGGGGGGGGNQADYDGTPGLAFELITSGAGRAARAADDGNAYRVRKGTVNSGDVVIPSHYKGKPVREIGSANDDENNGAFADTDITDITIPDTVDLIGPNAFRRNRRLTRLVIPEGVTVIGSEALYDCVNITSITIPASVTLIYSGVLSSNRRLTDIKVDPDNPNYRGEGGILYTNIEGLYVDGIHYTDDKEKTVLHSYPSAKDNVTISSSVTHIGETAFGWCENLASVTINEGVVLIGHGAFAFCTNLTSITIPASVVYVPGSVFSGCTNLTSINVASDSINYTSKDGMLFNNNPDHLSLYAYPSAKGNVTNLPSDLKSIDVIAFEYNTDITSVTIPNDLKYIHEYAFRYCTSITSITIPSSVTLILNGAFDGWTSSQIINVPYADQTAADNAFARGISGSSLGAWRKGCNATINYQP
jgi:hypothetical protein